MHITLAHHSQPVYADQVSLGPSKNLAGFVTGVGSTDTHVHTTNWSANHPWEEVVHTLGTYMVEFAESHRLMRPMA